jgi:hypothetical protein
MTKQEREREKEERKNIGEGDLVNRALGTPCLHRRRMKPGLRSEAAARAARQSAQ